MQDSQVTSAQDFVAFGARELPRRVADRGGVITVSATARPSATFAFCPSRETLRLLDAQALDAVETGEAVLAALEAEFAWRPERDVLDVALANRPDVLAWLADRGVVTAERGRWRASAAMLMQRPEPWLAKGGEPPYPERFVLSGSRRHPLRRPKPEGVVYARFLPWLGETLTFRAATVGDDLETFHRWMNDPRVAAFWTEAGDLAAHRRYLEALVDDPHMIPMIGAFDGAPFAYFEIYWAKENRLAPFYDVDDYDRGWHVAVGEESRRGGAYIGAWLPSLMHFMFLDDPRTRRIVGEPATAHVQQIRNLERSGFAQIKTFDFPHKRATLVSLLRERFFAEKLWLPARRDAQRPPAVALAGAA